MKKIVVALNEAGIVVKNNKIRKSDVKKAVQVIASTSQDVYKAAEGKDRDSLTEILLEACEKTISNQSDSDDLYWDAVGLLDMLDAQYTYVTFRIDDETAYYVLKKSDLSSTIEKIKNAPDAEDDEADEAED